jgi:hypothetical protein
MILSEILLHFIWEKKVFNKKLTTVCNKSVEVIDTGKRNTNQGPDFLYARLLIGDTKWAGNVEIHITSKEYNHHGHDLDLNYNNVILHVVWRHDSSSYNHSPILELSNCINEKLLPVYYELMKGQSLIACSKWISVNQDEKISSWISSLGHQLQVDRAIKFIELLNSFNGNWEQAIWVLLCRNFGLKVNSNSFNELAFSIPISLVRKYKGSRISIEALLMGQVGLLSESFKDEYAKELWVEFNRLKYLHKINFHSPPVYFLRMRPASFPTIRLAQLASFIESITSLLIFCKSCNSTKSVMHFFKVKISSYWDSHYVFDSLPISQHKSIGDAFIFTLIINTIVPVLTAYGRMTGREQYIIQANELLMNLPPESNKVIKEFKKIGLVPRNAKESQSYIQLYNAYCSIIKCTECEIGICSNYKDSDYSIIQL